MARETLEYQRERMGCIHAGSVNQDILNIMELDNLEYLGVGLNGFISDIDKNN